MYHREQQLQQGLPKVSELTMMMHSIGTMKAKISPTSLDSQQLQEMGKRRLGERDGEEEVRMGGRGPQHSLVQW